MALSEDQQGKILGRRRRAVVIPHTFIFELLNGGMERVEFVRIPKPLGLPETVKVVSVHHDWSMDAFVMVIEDKSFNEIPEGFVFPYEHVEWMTVEMAKKD